MLGIFAESMTLAARVNPARSRDEIARLRREDEDWISLMRDRRHLTGGH